MVTIWQRRICKICDTPLVLKHLGTFDRLGASAIAHRHPNQIDGTILDPACYRISDPILTIIIEFSSDIGK
jgi:hypothetical protein